MKETYYFPFVTELNESNQFVSVLNELYARLGDELSKEMFKCRVMYNLTYDYKFVREMVDMTDYGKAFSCLLDKYEDQRIYIYGASDRGDKIHRLYPEKNWKGYIDEKGGNGSKLNGLPIFSPEEVDPSKNDSLIFVSDRTCPEKIKEELISRGFDQELIVTWNEWNREAAKKNYFDDSVFKDHFMLANGTFIDGGCFNGVNTEDYLNWMENDNLDVVAFEADPINYEKCLKRLSKYKNVEICNVGLSDKQEELYFKAAGVSSSSFLKRGGENLVKTDTIDNVLNGRKVSLIKMDIEGYEENALRGAARTISEQKPALAISIYHKRDDILTIPKVILEYYKDYTFYFRHYFLGSNETVLYAINEK